MGMVPEKCEHSHSNGRLCKVVSSRLIEPVGVNRGSSANYFWLERYQSLGHELDAECLQRVVISHRTRAIAPRPSAIQTTQLACHLGIPTQAVVRSKSVSQEIRQHTLQANIKRSTWTPIRYASIICESRLVLSSITKAYNGMLIDCLAKHC
jgi:hypothetical protein